MNIQGRPYLSVLLLTCLLLDSPLNAQTGSSLEQLPRPVLEASKLTETPKLDGNIANDSAWKGAQPTSGFTQVQPNLGAPASQKTEVFMGYTEDAVY
ncbi:MAG: hypothetical protein VYA14_00570, partial [Pseudomonadota bacterium]|nr:hypothetical protein [Pseudomonadota bacterium]